MHSAGAGVLRPFHLLAQSFLHSARHGSRAPAEPPPITVDHSSNEIQCDRAVPTVDASTYLQYSGRSHQITQLLSTALRVSASDMCSHCRAPAVESPHQRESLPLEATWRRIVQWARLPPCGSKARSRDQILHSCESGRNTQFRLCPRRAGGGCPAREHHHWRWQSCRKGKRGNDQ